MALVLKTAPVDPPVSDSDWTRTQELITMLFLGNNGPILRVVGGNIVKGSVFQIGGAIYYADSDTAISGVESDYVKITPAGATASASYVDDLSGVSWNDEYNGYVDASGNLYVFDETIAISDGKLSDYRKEDGNCVKIFGDQTVGGLKTFLEKPLLPDEPVVLDAEAISRKQLAHFVHGVWTTSKSAEDNQWRSVCYGNGLFVAVADSGTGNRVMKALAPPA